MCKLVKLKQQSVCKCLCTPVHLQVEGREGCDTCTQAATCLHLGTHQLCSGPLCTAQATTLLASILLRPQAESAEEGCLKLRHRKHQKYARRKHSYELADKEEGGCLRYSNSPWNSTLTKTWFRYRHEICQKIYTTRFSIPKILQNFTQQKPVNHDFFHGKTAQMHRC